MKKLILIIAIVFSGMLMQAQILVNEHQINELDLEYVELVGAIKGQPTTTVVYIDFGQVDFLWEILPKNNPKQTISDINGEKVKSGSLMSAFNLMIKNGWEYVSSNTLSQPNSHQVRYLMKKIK